MLSTRFTHVRQRILFEAEIREISQVLKRGKDRKREILWKIEGQKDRGREKYYEKAVEMTNTRFILSPSGYV